MLSGTKKKLVQKILIHLRRYLKPKCKNLTLVKYFKYANLNCENFIYAR